MQSAPTLISLASRQVWPQILAVTHLRPRSLVLLHSDDEGESQGPAKRLSRFFERSRLLRGDAVHLQSVRHDDFAAVGNHLDKALAESGPPPSTCIVNVTGGNKLMAAAALFWAFRRGVKAFYLDRGNTITWFTPADGKIKTSVETLDGHCTDDLDPVDLLRCHLQGYDIERPGQCLKLNQRGQEIGTEQFTSLLRNGHALQDLLDITGEADRDVKKGDALEANTAAVLLKHGVKRVQQSLRLKAPAAHGVSIRSPLSELDLIFNWNGRLWLVDCKDRVQEDRLFDRLERVSQPVNDARQQEYRDLLESCRGRLKQNRTHALKEDLLAVRQIGGLLGQAVCVRKTEFDQEISQFARANGIAVVLKRDLWSDLGDLIHPDRPASQADLADLAAALSS